LDDFRPAISFLLPRRNSSGPRMSPFKPIVLLLVGLHVLLGSASAAVENARPNIVFIMVDDHSYLA
jgi:hypothetical protein